MLLLRQARNLNQCEPLYLFRYFEIQVLHEQTLLENQVHLHLLFMGWKMALKHEKLRLKHVRLQNIDGVQPHHLL